MPPLVVDLDGTLVRTDMLVESAVLLLRQNPFSLFLMLWWWLRGRAHLKAEIARRVTPAYASLPYRRVVLEYLQSQRLAGRYLVLASAADATLAQAIAERLGLFDTVFASDGRINLSGAAKSRLLVDTYGEQGFDYVGDSGRDLAVWRAARQAVLVAPSSRLRAQTARVTEIHQVLEDERATVRDWLQALRLFHWLKNLLVFAPVLMAHELDDPTLLASATIAFVAFGCCASSVYLLNDLMDLEADRHHPRKRERPIASGRLRLGAVLGLIPLLLVAAFATASSLPSAFGLALGAYYAANAAYSLRLKLVPILDVLMLAGLYTLRILAGAAAVRIPPSTWMLTFVMFLFLSLALVKRYAELMSVRAVDGPHARARGYQLDDAELLAALGGGAGYLAVLVLALNIDTSTSHALYREPRCLWALCLLLLYWVSHLWLMAHRRRMHDDPLVFALRDPTSRILLSLMALTVFAAM